MLAHFAHHLVTALPVPLLPFIRSDLGLDYTQSGLVISAFSLAYGLSQLPSGWLADRIGPRILITTSTSGVALAGFLVGLSPDFMMMIVCFVLMGLVGGGYHPAAPTLISAAVDTRLQGRAMGLHMMGGSTPFFLAPLAAAVIAGTFGWRATFVALSVPTMVFGIILYRLMERLRGRIDTEKKKFETRQEAVSRAPGRFRRLVPFIVLSTITQAVAFTVISFIPLFMIDQMGVSKETAATFLSIIYSAALWATVGGGYLSDRFGAVPVVLLACLVTGPVIYLMTHASYGIGIVFLLFLLGVSQYVRLPVCEAYLVSEAPVHYRSTIMGIYFFSFIEGGGLLTPVMGYLIDRFGFPVSFQAAGASIFLVSLICWIWLWRVK